MEKPVMIKKLADAIDSVLRSWLSTVLRSLVVDACLF